MPDEALNKLRKELDGLEELNPKQLVQKVKAQKISKEILGIYPKTAEQVTRQYNIGFSISELAEMHFPEESVTVSYRVVYSILENTLKSESYTESPEEDYTEPPQEPDDAPIIENSPQISSGPKGLFALSPEERKKATKKGGIKSYLKGVGAHGMSKKDRRKASQKGGDKSYKEGKGAFGITQYERRKASIKGGEIGGATAHYKGVGIHAMDSKGKRDAGRQGLHEMGIEPYDTYSFVTGRTEGEEIMFQFEQPENRRGRGVSRISVAKKVNSIYHKNRTPQMIGQYNQDQKARMKGLEE